MMYYKLSHMNRGEIQDVEERITRDPRRFCKGLADEMEKLSAAATSGVWFTLRLTQISSLPYAVSPLIYFFMAFQGKIYVCLDNHTIPVYTHQLTRLVSMKLAPNWSKRWREMLDMRGVYEKSQTRLQTHAEAICAYQGNNQERMIIEERYHEFLAYCVKFVRDASLFQFVASAFFDYGAHSFAELMIIGSFISANVPGKAAIAAAKTPKEKVEASAELFSKVRYLTEYFIRAMAAQGTIISVLRQLQNMAGPARRLTALFDTLEEFEKNKDQSTTFIDNPNRIEFSNVQVFTPTGK